MHQVRRPTDYRHTTIQVVLLIVVKAASHIKKFTVWFPICNHCNLYISGFGLTRVKKVITQPKIRLAHQHYDMHYGIHFSCMYPRRIRGSQPFFSSEGEDRKLECLALLYYLYEDS